MVKVEAGQTWRPAEGIGLYTVVGVGLFRDVCWIPCVVYRDGAGAWFVRPEAAFRGRFILVEVPRDV